MASISQKKFIDIASSVIQASLGDRDLSGLVFSKGTAVGTGAYATVTADYNSGKVITVKSSKEADNVFGSDSDEAKFANKYFSYVNPSGRTPRALNFMKVVDGDTPKDAFDKAIGATDNFGSFTFLGDDFELAALKTVYDANQGLNFQFLAVHGEEIAENSSDHVTNATTLGEIEGTHFVIGADMYCAAMPMAIAASVRYTPESAATCFMYKTFPSETPCVSDDTTYDLLVGKNINFYGQTQVNGRMLSFYMPGFNLDGVDTAVYMNEVWLKSRVVTNFFNLMKSVERVPANYVGEAMITSSVVMPAVNDALSNGVIMPGKELSDEVRAVIYQYTGDEDAVNNILVDGYWYSIRIEPDGENYKAIYQLVYSKGDSVRFVDGSHTLV